MKTACVSQCLFSNCQCMSYVLAGWSVGQSDGWMVGHLTSYIYRYDENNLNVHYFYVYHIINMLYHIQTLINTLVDSGGHKEYQG